VIDHRSAETNALSSDAGTRGYRIDGRRVVDRFRNAIVRPLVRVVAGAGRTTRTGRHESENSDRP
jgi:hypothetical protein